MPEQDDHSYLSKPLIPDTEFIIEDNKVMISCPNTIFVHVRLSPTVEKQELLALYKRVITLAKEKKVPISYSAHINRTIKERWGEYVLDCVRMLARFHRIIAQSRVVKKRGLHYGTRDDVELEKLQHFCDDYEKFLNSGSVVSLISDIRYRLEGLAADLSELEYRWDHIAL